MLKNTLQWLVITCTLLASTNSLLDVGERLKGRIIHIESQSQRGWWLMPWYNRYQGQDDKYILRLYPMLERETYYEPKVQFKATSCGEESLCFESMFHSGYFLTDDKYYEDYRWFAVVEESSYPEGDRHFYWKVLCEDDSMGRCKLYQSMYEDRDPLSADYFDSRAMFSDYGPGKWFRIHAPNPTDSYRAIFTNTNNGTKPQTAKYSTTIGVSKLHSTTHQITRTVSLEVGAAFKAFSASASSTIEKSWQQTTASTFEAAVTVEHQLNLPPRATIILKQNFGNYAGEFDVGQNDFLIVEIPLDGGHTISHKTHI